MIKYLLFFTCLCSTCFGESLWVQRANSEYIEIATVLEAVDELGKPIDRGYQILRISCYPKNPLFKDDEERCVIEEAILVRKMKSFETGENQIVLNTLSDIEIEKSYIGKNVVEIFFKPAPGCTAAHFIARKDGKDNISSDLKRTMEKYFYCNATLSFEDRKGSKLSFKPAKKPVLETSILELW